MKLLLDTHLLLWAAALSARLPAQAADLISDEENEVSFSPASISEIAIKQIKAPELVPISARHLLPAIHADPIDRILIAEATVEGITLLTSDRLVAQYPGPILSVLLPLGRIPPQQAVDAGRDGGTGTGVAPNRGWGRVGPVPAGPLGVATAISR